MAGERFRSLDETFWMDRLRGVEKSPKSVADCASSAGTAIAFESTALKSLLVHVKSSSSILNMQAHQLIAGFIASFDLKTFDLNIFGMKLKIFSIFWADDIWKNSAPHKINYKQLAIVCLMILRRRKIEEKFFRIKLKLIEWMKTEKIYCLFRDLHGIGVEIASRNVLNALVGMQVAISIAMLAS